MIPIAPGIRIDENEISIDFVRASGPGGQNVNKVATAAQLRFDVAGSTSLPEGVKRRLIQMAGKRVTSEGLLIIEARRYRTQEANRADAVQRFTELVRKASQPPKKRKPTKPTAESREKRLLAKKRRGEIKRNRRDGRLE
jgi:ribosome-associated protein